MTKNGNSFGSFLILGYQLAVFNCGAVFAIAMKAHSIGSALFVAFLGAIAAACAYAIAVESKTEATT